MPRKDAESRGSGGYSQHRSCAETGEGHSCIRTPTTRVREAVGQIDRSRPWCGQLPVDCGFFLAPADCRQFEECPRLLALTVPCWSTFLIRD